MFSKRDKTRKLMRQVSKTIRNQNFWGRLPFPRRHRQRETFQIYFTQFSALRTIPFFIHTNFRRLDHAHIDYIGRKQKVFVHFESFFFCRSYEWSFFAAKSFYGRQKSFFLELSFLSIAPAEAKQILVKLHKLFSPFHCLRETYMFSSAQRRWKVPFRQNISFLVLT